MAGEELAEFLAWALPRMGLRQRGFANFRGTLKKRIGRRMAELGGLDLAGYRARLEGDERASESEWRVLDSLCRITISRLYRDRATMEIVGNAVLPEAAARGAQVGLPVCVRVWSAGCASGEEPYTIAILWRMLVAPAFPDVRLEIVATDADASLLERAARGVYASGSLRELPAALRDACARPCWTQQGESYVLDEEIRRAVAFEEQDLRRDTPPGEFDVVLCRNLAFTYFDAATQERVGRSLVSKLAPAGALVIGEGEVLPDSLLEVVSGEGCVYRASADRLRWRSEPQ